MLISERIYQYLEEKGMSQIEFAKRTGISQSTISDWRRKGTNPSADKIMIICDVLRISPYELLLETDSKNPREYRQADYVVIDKNSREYELIRKYEKLAPDARRHLERDLQAHQNKDGERENLMGNEKEIVLFETEDKSIVLPVSVESDTVWLSANQMAILFGRDEKTIRKHINNVFSEEELIRENNTQKMRVVGVKQTVPFYTLDVIISVGYRVKSKRGVEFRRWANSVLKDYIIKGYAVNCNRMSQLNEVIRVMKRVENSLDTRQVLTVVERYSQALELLDAYDHQNMKRPKGNKGAYVLTYEECRKVIDSMKFGESSSLFGNEKDDSFKGSIGAVYQSFGGEDLYPTLEEKAANLLYFITKNHSFSDGNKRIAATIFLYFLDKNGVLFQNGSKLIDDHTLVALTIMIAESDPKEKEMMISVIMNCMQ